MLLHFSLLQVKTAFYPSGHLFVPSESRWPAIIAVAVVSRKRDRLSIRSQGRLARDRSMHTLEPVGIGLCVHLRNARVDLYLLFDSSILIIPLSVCTFVGVL